MTRKFLVLVILFQAMACTAPLSTGTRPSDYYDLSSSRSSGASLFSGDQSVLSDEAIGRILEFEYSPPPLSRVALMPFGRELWSEWSEELALASGRMRDDVLGRLVSSPRVYDASYLPSILIPGQKTVPHLREAAARYQADLLLVYRSYCRSFDRYRVLSEDRSRAYCGVEAVLLDTRTGLVPFTSVALQSFEASENEADINFQETVLKAQLNATAEALSGVVGEVVAFLSEN